MNHDTYYMTLDRYVVLLINCLMGILCLIYSPVILRMSQCLNELRKEYRVNTKIIELD